MVKSFERSHDEVDAHPEVLENSSLEIAQRQAHTLNEKVINEGIELNLGARWTLLRQDPLAREGLDTLGRTGANVVLAGLEVIPVAGQVSEVPTLINTAIKPLTRLFPQLSRANLTPDVSFKRSLAYAGTEVVTGTLAPGYFLDAGNQLIEDLKRSERFKVGATALGYLFTGKTTYLEEINHQRDMLDAAAKLFETSGQSKEK